MIVNYDHKTYIVQATDSINGFAVLIFYSKFDRKQRFLQVIAISNLIAFQI
jgi:hypothetical protein